jgi:putative membrane protein
VALQGNKWFLGQIYGYRQVGVHYGVPLSNYLGWWMVGFLMILALQVIDRIVGRNIEHLPGVANLPFRSLIGPTLYVSVLVFNLAMTFLIGERQMALTGIFTYILPVAIVVVLSIRRTNRYSKDEMADHMRDFPLSVAGGRR